MIKAVILDFDGIILESVDIKGEVFAEVFKDYPQHRQAILDYHYANGGVPRFEKFRYIYKNFLKKPLSDEKFHELCHQYADLVVQRVLKVDFVPGAHEFLKNYYQKYHLYIVSGTPDEEIKMIVRSRHLEQFFKAVYGSPQTKGAWTKKILDEAPYASSEVIWVGDALSDWQAAHDHHIKFIGRIYPHLDIFQDRPLETKIKSLENLGKLIDDQF
jgi:HAD superfamily hydrolase (TIGR01549 family)